MKLIIILSVAALVACDYSTPEHGAPSSAFTIPEKIEITGGNIQSGKPLFNFKNFYQGGFPSTRFPSTGFPTTGFPTTGFPTTGFPTTRFPTTLPLFNSPYKAFNYASSPQGILPPISQIIPPQLSQIIPPIFGNPKPILPTPSPVAPPAFSPQVLPPLSNPLLNKFTYPSLYSPYSQSYYSSLYQYPHIFPPTFNFPPTSFPTLPQKQPEKNQPESPSNSYGPPSTESDPEPTSSDDNSAPFEPSSVSFPYESAAAETQEPATHHKPAQEYGLPPSK